MFVLTSVFYILSKTNCFYKEVEGNTKPSDLQTTLLRTVASSKFYWFEHQSIIYLLRFEDNPEFHKNAFILLLAVPNAKSETWSESRDDKSLTDALNNFRNTSAFLSLLPNKQDRNYYMVSVNVNRNKLQMRVVLEKHKLFVELESEVQEHADYTYLLNSTKIGTKFWDCFYGENNHFQELFVKVYYIVYPETLGYSKSVVLFRVGDVTEVSFVVFQTKLVEEKTFLETIERVYEMQLHGKQRTGGKELFRFEIVEPFSFCFFYFDLRERTAEQLEIKISTPKLQKKAEKPVVQRLLQVGHKVCLVTDDKQRTMRIELPVFFFRKRLEISELSILVKVSDNSLSEKVLLRTFAFRRDEDYCEIDIGRSHYIYLKYNNENGKLIFSMFKIAVLANEVNVLSIEEIERTVEPTKTRNDSVLLNGAVFYNPTSAVVLTGYEPTSEKRFEKRISKTQGMYLYLGLVFVFSFFLFMCYFYFNGKTTENKNFSNRTQTKMGCADK